MKLELEEATRPSLKERVLVLLGKRDFGRYLTDSTLQVTLVHVVGILNGLSGAD